MIRKFILFAAMSAMVLSGCDAGTGLNAKEGVSKKSAVTAGTNAVTQGTAASTAKTKRVKPLGYLLDLNEASDEQLKRIPGMTAEIQDMIKQSQPFFDMIELEDELLDLSVSSKAQTSLYEHIFMIIDINNGPLDDLAFVPGLSKNLAHKIESSAPYDKADDLAGVIKNSRQSDDVERLMPFFKITKRRKQP